MPRRATLTDEERKERKRLADKAYREKKKEKQQMEQASSQNSDCSSVQEEDNTEQTYSSSDVKELIKVLISFNNDLSCDIQGLKDDIGEIRTKLDVEHSSSLNKVQKYSNIASNVVGSLAYSMIGLNSIKKYKDAKRSYTAEFEKVNNFLNQDVDDRACI